MTRFTFNFLKPVAIFLSIIVLFQCCMVYDKRPVTIEQAINKNHKKQKRIKIEMVDGKILKLSSIYYKENRLFGILFKSEEDEPLEVNINEDEIIKILLQDRKKSAIRTTFLIIPISVIGVLTLLLLTQAPTIN